MLMRQKQS